MMDKQAVNLNIQLMNDDPNCKNITYVSWN